MFIGQLIISGLLASVISAGGNKKKAKQESQILVWESDLVNSKPLAAAKAPQAKSPAAPASAPASRPKKVTKEKKSASGFINPYIDGVLAQGRPIDESSYKIEFATSSKKPKAPTGSSKKPKAPLSSDSFLNNWKPLGESSDSESDEVPDVEPSVESENEEELEQVFEAVEEEIEEVEEHEDDDAKLPRRKPCRKPQKPQKPCRKPAPKPCSSTSSSTTSEIPCPSPPPPSSSSSSSPCHSSSSSSSSCHCRERPNPFLDCSKEQSIATVYEKNELFGNYWNTHKYNLIYSSNLVHLEATYKIKEIGLDGKCQWIEGPLFDYIEQPGTFKSFVQKYTWNKGNRTITVTVLEVGNVNGEVVVRRVKRKYMSLRGCEYALWTVIGENTKCCPDKPKK
jgi:hypothetical protein